VILDTWAVRPASNVIHLRARRLRRRVMSMLLRRLVRDFAEWLRSLGQMVLRLARDLTVELLRRRDIRRAQRFDDRALADMGVGRSEIEHVVRRGRC